MSKTLNQELISLVKLYLFYLYKKDKTLLDVDTRDAAATQEALNDYFGLEVSDKDNPWTVLPGSSDLLFGNVDNFNYNYLAMSNALRQKATTLRKRFIREGQAWFINKIARQYDVRLHRIQKHYLKRLDLLADYIKKIQASTFRNAIDELERPLKLWDNLRSWIPSGVIIGILVYRIWRDFYETGSKLFSTHFFGIAIGIMGSCYFLDLFITHYLGKQASIKFKALSWFDPATTMVVPNQ